MWLNILEIAGPMIAALIMLIGIIRTIRSELKKNNENLMNARIIDERRHSAHERRISIMEQRIGLIESSISIRLDETNNNISRLNHLIVDHLRNDKHNDK